MLQAPFLEVSVGKSSERILTQCRQVKFPTFRTNFNFCARFDSEKCVQSEDTSTRTINRCNKYSQTVERVSIIRIRIWEELKGRINYQYYEFLLVVWVWMTEGSRKMSAVMYLSMILIAIFIFVADHSDSLEREFIVFVERGTNWAPGNENYLFFPCWWITIGPQLTKGVWMKWKIYVEWSRAKVLIANHR